MHDQFIHRAPEVVGELGQYLALKFSRKCEQEIQNWLQKRRIPYPWQAPHFTIFTTVLKNVIVKQERVHLVVPSDCTRLVAWGGRVKNLLALAIRSPYVYSRREVLLAREQKLALEGGYVLPPRAPFYPHVVISNIIEPGRLRRSLEEWQRDFNVEIVFDRFLFNTALLEEALVQTPLSLSSEENRRRIERIQQSEALAAAVQQQPPTPRKQPVVPVDEVDEEGFIWNDSWLLPGSEKSLHDE